MTKDLFINELRDKLKGLPKDEIDERISFYEELIDDMIEDGKTEEDAINEIGTVEEVSTKITSEIPLTKLVKERIKPKKELKVWQLVLLLMGFPIWFPIWLAILIICAALIITISIVLWSLVLVLYVLTFALGVGGIGLLVLFFIQLFNGSFDLFALGTAFASFGLSILFFFASYYFSVVITKLHKLFFLSLKKGLIKGNNK